MALVMAVGIMFVLSLTLTSIIFYTSSTNRDAARSNAGQKAYALAEGALNIAVAQLASHYYDSSGTPNNTSNPGDQSWMSGTQSQQSPASTTACTTSSTCMTWQATWSAISGSLTTKGTWSITATGTVPNPTGSSASAIRRTVTATTDVAYTPNPPSIWQWVYSGTNTTISNGAIVKAPLWVKGILALQQSAAIEQPSGGSGNRLVVGFDNTGTATGGTLDLSASNSQGHVGGNGTSTPPASTYLSEGHLSGTCVSCGAGKIYVTGGLSSAAPTQKFPATTLAPADWLDRYTNASPGPNHDPCSGIDFDKNGTADGLNDDMPAFTLNGTTSYSCTIDSNDYITWNASTHVLTAKGTIFFDGPLSISATKTSYVGIANIYSSDNISFANNAVFCAKLASSGSTCDWTNWDPNYNASTNPNPSMLILASDASVSGQNVSFQGGLYGQTSINVGGGSAGGVQGPMVSPGTVTMQQGAGSSFPTASILSPGYPLDPYTLSPLKNRSG